MSFGNFARKVRDPSRPFGRRVQNLRSCVQLYRPVGFHGTLAYLAEVAGPYDCDERALLDALRAIETSRALWHQEIRRYDAARREPKRQGRRQPPEPNPCHFPRQWYGAPAPAALAALRYWHRRKLPTSILAVPLYALVRDLLVTDGAGPADHWQARLDEVRARLTPLMAAERYHADTVTWFQARDLLGIAYLVEQTIRR